MNKTVIYGAGKYAKALYRRFQTADRTHEIAYFLVTEKSNKEQTIDGKNVFSFEEKRDDLQDKNVIVAISPNNVSEVLDKIKNCKPHKLICMSRLEYKRNELDCIEIAKKLPIIRNKVVFYCFEGRGYMCNCKYLAEYLRSLGKYELVWVIRENLEIQKQEIPSDIKIVKRFSLDYYKELYTAGFVITNFNNPAGVYKREGQYYINTWHGIGPFKTAGLDAKFNEQKIDNTKNYASGHNLNDLKIAASDDCVNMYRNSMLYKGEVMKCGYPRNDIFFKNDDRRTRIREKFGIADDQVTVLYAPTFRDNYDNFKDSFRFYDIDMKSVMDCIGERFRRNTVLMYRFHQYLQDYDECKSFYSGAINVTEYMDTQELLLAADILITDYSSIMWDFSLMKKPVFLYHKDAEEYMAFRGFYSSPDTWPYPHARNSEEMCDLIRNFDSENYVIQLENFFKKYGSYDDGHACEKIASRMWDVVQNPSRYGKDIEEITIEDDYFTPKCLMPRVSIIVPVYNGEKYLRQCLDSIINQTLQDIEIICVDDGSTDSSSEILDAYAECDARVRVLHNKNHGYGYSVNCGFRAARGRYVAIVESDDFVARNMYDRLYELAVDNYLDLVKAECYFCWDSIRYRVRRHIKKMNPYYNIVLQPEDRDKFFGFLMNTWSGIYLKDFLDRYDITHHESVGASYQDNGFWIQTMYHARRAMWIPEQLYYYRQDNECASVMSNSKIFEMTKEYEWAEEQLRKLYLDNDQLDWCFYYRLFRNKGTFLRISDDKKMDFYPQLLADYSKYGYVLDAFASKKAVELLKNSSDDQQWFFKEFIIHQELKSWYESLINDPQKEIEKNVGMKKMILNQISNSDAVYILGTNYLAQRIKRILFREGLNDKIAAFIQLSPITNCCVGDNKVVEFNDPDVCYDNCTFIIGLEKGSEEYKKYVEVLDELGIQNRIECRDMVDNFYWIY